MNDRHRFLLQLSALIIAALFSLVIGWGIWATTELYAQREKTTQLTTKFDATCDVVLNLRTDISSLREEMRHLQSQLSTNQQELMKLLILLRNHQTMKETPQ